MPGSIAPRNYLQKIDQFTPHWTNVNAAPGGALVLPGPYNLASLGTARTALAAIITALVAAQNSVQAASADRDLKRGAIKERMRQFNSVVRASFPNSIYSAQLPKLPLMTSAPGAWMQAMEDAANVWSQINNLDPIPGVTIPLVLTGGYNRAAFVADQAALVAAMTLVETTAANALQKRRDRDVAWTKIYNELKQYRLAVQGRFSPADALYQSLPALTPPSGHTPAAVNVSAAWDSNLAKAVVTYTNSSDPDLANYELRACFGNRYRTDEEQVLATNAPGTNPPRFATDAGLVASGSRVFYKVYVVLTTDNEKGSKSVSVTRP